MQNIMKNLLILSLLVLFCFDISAQENDNIAVQARKAYDSGQYESSIQLYESIVQKGFESAVLYYNLGNAYFRNKDLPSAALYYEKALKLDPNNPDILHNIEFVNSKIIDKVEPVPELFYKRWWKSLLNLMNLDVVAVLMIILLTLSLVFAGIYLSSSRLNIRKIAFYTSASMLLLMLASFLVAREKKHYLTQHHEAIVFTPTVTVKSSPDAASTDLFVIHEGLKVTLLDKIGEWQEIRIANGSIGWLQTSDIRNI